MKKAIKFLTAFSILILAVSIILISDYYLPSKTFKEKIVKVTGYSSNRSGGFYSSGGSYYIIETEKSSFYSQEGHAWPSVDNDTLNVSKTPILHIVKSYSAHDKKQSEFFQPEHHFYEYIFFPFATCILSIMFFIIKIPEHKIMAAAINIILTFSQTLIWLAFG